MQSGTSRSGAQSPPPIALPARTVASGRPSERNADAACSCAAFDAEYGSSPPSGSSSRSGVPAPSLRYALSLVTTTTAPGSVSARTASSTFAVPVTLTVNVSTGLARPRRTSACAAMWMTTSGRARATAARTSLLERTSPRVSPAIPVPTAASSYSEGSLAGPELKPCTCAPSDWSQSASHAPLKPVWPVSQTRLPSQKARSGIVSAREQPHVGVDHQPDQLLEVGARLPPEHALGLGRVADEQVDLGGTLERIVDLHVRLPVQAGVVERDLDAAPHGVRRARRDHEVLRNVLLEHQPHRLDVVLRIAPVAACQVILRVTNSSPRRGLSWLNRIPEQSAMS